jgi:hypothetical protein
MKQFIFGDCSPVSLNKSIKKSLFSSAQLVVEDYVSGSRLADAGPVLCSFKSVPIAFWDVPTCNMMIFSRRLWENLLDNAYLKKSLEEGSHYGCSAHQDTDQIDLKDVAGRVTRFWVGDNNYILGDVDILNTPCGVVVYTLAKISRVGISSRGFGELKSVGDGLKEVVPEEYSHVCFDFVNFPAVPDASMTLITGENKIPTQELEGMSEGLRSLVRDAYDRSPGDAVLRGLYNSLEGRGSGGVRNAVSAALMAQQFRYSRLLSRKGNTIISRRSIVSAPVSESWELYDTGLERRLDVFCRSLGARLTTEFGTKALASWDREFLRGNNNVYYRVHITFGGKTQVVLRIVGGKTGLDYQISLFGVKWENFVRAGFFNNSLVSRIVGYFTGGIE